MKKNSAAKHFTSMKNNRKKIAVVTGGGSGLGFAIAQKFTQHNIETIIIGRNIQKLERAQQQLGSSCHIMCCDLSDLATIPSLIQKIVETHGRIDILINNAGINMKKDFTEVTDEDFAAIINTNLNAVFAISREVVKDMLKYNSGCIINISSMAAQYGLPKVIAYSASKSAIDGITRAMATELSPKGIRVNAIAPGFIYSDMTAKALNEDIDRKTRVFARTPMGKMGQPEDIGEAALFLASEGAGFITGVVLPVDGGNSIGF
ncbi:NAD(P)-dependent dehydrogenase, short-chain alcohol dehydrogenase family [Parafilimonas terrae]|uniref:NAD(P)-dependent dehydrogenase, short-chain alcohol dehydrogenase family n=2 Tax=Parafilimonas terrae TaxID=1465490 RepID=A0A1I5YTZ5_9BACT|nr:NAD(P)-dependent dehydrogenase, short-chain alcohol dehydrogenase family [Parafilimonas terrae]